MANSFTIEAFALLGVGLSAIGIRTYARCSTVGLRGLKPDDILMLGAAVSYILPILLAQLSPFSYSPLHVMWQANTNISAHVGRLLS